MQQSRGSCNLFEEVVILDRDKCMSIPLLIGLLVHFSSSRHSFQYKRVGGQRKEKAIGYPPFGPLV